jgi:hypothetical protein
MIKTCLLIMISLFTGSKIYAQSDADSVMYNNGLALLNKANTTENFLESAFYFEKLAKEFPSQWLVHYYAGLSYILAAQKGLDSKYRDDLLNKAQVLVDKSFSYKPAEAEIHVLQAFLYQVRLQIEPQGRAISFAQKAEASIKKALEADSANPRAYFLQANNVYYTPPVFKGGPKNALPVFLKAKQQFETYSKDLSFLPAWGEQQNDEMIRLCKTAKN